MKITDRINFVRYLHKKRIVGVGQQEIKYEIGINKKNLSLSLFMFRLSLA
jgi:hypothetical protein